MEIIPIGAPNSLGHMAPLGLMGERYISHRATKFDKDSNTSRFNQLRHPAPRRTRRRKKKNGTE
ncbi:hypothetical protein E2C01_080383 [Portunus trituberculatus]|uniref:Uncharacterized protein n=1 Tax=Portunus trituberculatus TaxID=210409 RepID=A0A5B7IP60_PORTR|nr:hypothetical protein [Portunus trituberculatus]